MIHKNNDIVLPGDVLCTYEEYIPSDWTYVDDGLIKADISGRVIIDEDEKTISITSINAPKHLEIGDYVIGHITEVKHNKALVTIKKIKESNRDLVTGYKGFIHISKSTDGFVSSMQELFKIGDIIEAKVTNIINAEYVDLTTMPVDTGVIKAMCVECRQFMKFEENKLVCECGKVDARKISINYGGY